MAYKDEIILRDKDQNPIPQYFNSATGLYEPLEGSYGSNSFIERGRLVKDAFNGSTTVTKTYQNNMFGFGIVNDGTSDLTVIINGFNIVVKSGEAFDDLFDPFKTVTITGTSAFRAVVRQ